MNGSQPFFSIDTNIIISLATTAEGVWHKNSISFLTEAKEKRIDIVTCDSVLAEFKEVLDEISGVTIEVLRDIREVVTTEANRFKVNLQQLEDYFIQKRKKEGRMFKKIILREFETELVHKIEEMHGKSVLYQEGFIELSNFIRGINSAKLQKELYIKEISRIIFSTEFTSALEKLLDFLTNKKDSRHLAVTAEFAASSNQYAIFVTMDENEILGSRERICNELPILFLSSPPYAFNLFGNIKGKLRPSKDFAQVGHPPEIEKFLAVVGSLLGNESHCYKMVKRNALE